MVSAQLLLKNGTVYPVSAPAFRGDILLEAGRIRALGENLACPDGEQIDLEGCVVLPGFIDPHCHIGLSESGEATACQGENEHTSPLLPELRAVDALNPADKSFQDAREAGVTCCVTEPGSSGLITGQFCAVKTWGSTLEEMLLRAPVAMKMALGENPKLAHGVNRKAAPETRMAEIAMLRQILQEAVNYGKKRESCPDGTPWNMKLEALLPVVRGELPVKIHVHRADDILSALRLAREFSLRVSLEHCTEGGLIVESLVRAQKEEGTKLLLDPLMMPRRKQETRLLSDHLPGALSQAGVTFGLLSDHPVTPVQYLNLYAGLARREGLSPEKALEAITLEAARACWIDDRVGSLEPGKDADIAVFRGDPLSLEGKCVMTLINGRIVYRAP